MGGLVSSSLDVAGNQKSSQTRPMGAKASAVRQGAHCAVSFPKTWWVPNSGTRSRKPASRSAVLQKHVLSGLSFRDGGSAVLTNYRRSWSPAPNVCAVTQTLGTWLTFWDQLPRAHSLLSSVQNGSAPRAFLSRYVFKLLSHISL